MTDRELMQQALEALTRIWEDGLENYPVAAHESVMDELRERLAQPEQKPVAFVDPIWMQRPDLIIEHSLEINKLFARVQVMDYVPLYTDLPRREWVGLTKEEIKILWIQYRAALPRYLCFALAIEANLKEKNNG